MEIVKNTDKENTAGMIEVLVKVGIRKEDAVAYVEIFKEHEIDYSILISNLLNQDLLKDIGITKAGHIVKILSIRHLGLNKAKEGVDYNVKPTEPLSLDAALNAEPVIHIVTSDVEVKTPTSDPMEKGNENITSTTTTTITTPHDEKMLQYMSDTSIVPYLDSDDEEDDSVEEKKPKLALPISVLTDAFIQRVKYIPVRLNEKERKQLHLLEAALNVSDYTDKVDIISYEKKSKRSHEQLKDMCAILSGLLVASDYPSGQKLVSNRQFKDNSIFFQEVFEVGRRYKIMNPEKMRTDYGKLVYMLQDSALPEIEALLQFSCIKPVVTVYNLLASRGGLDMLKDPHIQTATQAIIDDKNKSRDEIQRMIKDKERAVEYFAAKYETSQLPKSDIKLCLRSIGDNNSFLIGTRDPVIKMISLLTSNFRPDSYQDPYSLAISFGYEGARLSHDHERQYHFVLQSLTLWREVLNDMFKLWVLSEDDLLDSTNRYRLSQTGQGLNRVQQAPRVEDAMHKLLSNTKKKLESWVGSSVIHLGDHNVPNALMFIDKYNQVTRIVNPVVLTIDQIDEIVKDKGLKLYVDSTFGGKENLKMHILSDFFRHAFDGSGADNFFDAGSCIDGRLTSAWNWCEKLPKKDYYSIFKLCGFAGFDGDWQK